MTINLHIFHVLTIVFVFLKLLGIIYWDWTIVFLPSFIPLSVMVIGVIGIFWELFFRCKIKNR